MEWNEIALIVSGRDGGGGMAYKQMGRKNIC